MSGGQKGGDCLVMTSGEYPVSTHVGKKEGLHVV